MPPSLETPIGPVDVEGEGVVEVDIEDFLKDPAVQLPDQQPDCGFRLTEAARKRSLTIEDWPAVQRARSQAQRSPGPL